MTYAIVNNPLNLILTHAKAANPGGEVGGVVECASTLTRYILPMRVDVRVVGFVLECLRVGTDERVSRLADVGIVASGESGIPHVEHVHSSGSSTTVLSDSPTEDVVTELQASNSGPIVGRIGERNVEVLVNRLPEALVACVERSAKEANLLLARIDVLGFASGCHERAVDDRNILCNLTAGNIVPYVPCEERRTAPCASVFGNRVGPFGLEVLHLLVRHAVECESVVSSGLVHSPPASSIDTRSSCTERTVVVTEVDVLGYGDFGRLVPDFNSSPASTSAIRCGSRYFPFDDVLALLEAGNPGLPVGGIFDYARTQNRVPVASSVVLGRIHSCREVVLVGAPLGYVGIGEVGVGHEVVDIGGYRSRAVAVANSPGEGVVARQETLDASLRVGLSLCNLFRICEFYVVFAEPLYVGVALQPYAGLVFAERTCECSDFVAGVLVGSECQNAAALDIHSGHLRTFVLGVVPIEGEGCACVDGYLTIELGRVVEELAIASHELPRATARLVVSSVESNFGVTGRRVNSGREFEVAVGDEYGGGGIASNLLVAFATSHLYVPDVTLACILANALDCGDSRVAPRERVAVHHGGVDHLALIACIGGRPPAVGTAYSYCGDFLSAGAAVDYRVAYKLCAYIEALDGNLGVVGTLFILVARDSPAERRERIGSDILDGDGAILEHCGIVHIALTTDDGPLAVAETRQCAGECARCLAGEHHIVVDIHTRD